jgi:lysozyme family protein
MPGVDIENLSKDTAIEYYREHYWKPGYSQINDQLVADKLFDLGVLFGVGEAVGIMQLTLQGADETVKIDGDFGSGTLSAINLVDSESLLAHYKANILTHAISVATRNPAEREFLPGWIRRINCNDKTPCDKHQAAA